MKKFSLSIIAFLCTFIPFFTSCDDHIYEDESWHRWTPGMIYCTNGEINTYEEILNNGNIPEAVIFYVDTKNEINGKAYAVCIDEYPYRAFSDPDTIYAAQGTSADITTYDGEKNTTALRHSEIASPIAKTVNPKYFIPSVGEMYKMFTAKEIINPIIEVCGGTPIPINEEECWYWTSTECAGSESDRAWRYSLTSGRFESADKHTEYATRPILTIRLNLEEENENGGK